MTLLRDRTAHNAIGADPLAGRREIDCSDGTDLLPRGDGKHLQDPRAHEVELLSRLAALIPPPRRHSQRYYGVLSSHATLREQVIASAGPSGATAARLREAARQMDIAPHSSEVFAHTFPPTWAMLLARIYDALSLLCPRCGGAMRIIAFITHAADVKRILDHIGESSETPAIASSRAPPEAEFEFDQRVEDTDDAAM